MCQEPTSAGQRAKLWIVELRTHVCTAQAQSLVFRTLGSELVQSGTIEVSLARLQEIFTDVPPTSMTRTLLTGRTAATPVIDDFGALPALA